MSTVTSSFTAVGVTSSLRVAKGSLLTYAASGTFAGTWVLQRTGNGGTAWESLDSGTIAKSFSIPVTEDGTYRIQCTVYGSGTLVATLTDVATTVAPTYTFNSTTLTITLNWNGSFDIEGNLSVLESSTTPAVDTAGTIATADVGIARVTPAGAITGVIMQAGTKSGQIVTVVNQGLAASTITMAAAGTSNVANGVTTVIAGLTSRRFVWVAGAALWYTN